MINRAKKLKHERARWGTVPVGRRSASLRCYHRRKKLFLAQGLTVKGQPRKRVFKKYFTRIAKRAAQRQWSYAGYQTRRARNLAAGLTERGTVRVNRRFPELQGLASRNKSEYSRQTYHVLKHLRARTALTVLITGKAGLITKLKPA